MNKTGKSSFGIRSGTPKNVFSQTGYSALRLRLALNSLPDKARSKLGEAVFLASFDFNFGIKNNFTKQGLPLPGPKKLVNIAFPASKFRSGGGFNTSEIYFYILNNQLLISCTICTEGRFLRFEQTITLLEFNEPISKKGAQISKDLEKNGTDFEGFATLFEWILKPVQKHLHFFTYPINPTFAVL